MSRLGARGYIACSFACSEDDVPYAMRVLAKWTRKIEGVRYVDGAVHWRVDLAAVPNGDGRLVEDVIRRDVQRAISTHEVAP